MIARLEHERATLREGGRRLALILRSVAGAVRPGVATAELDRIAEDGIRAAGGAPVFQGYRTQPTDPPYPASLCVSINDEVVHGVPREDRIIGDGDLVGLDLGMRYPASGGLVTDMAVTIGVGAITPPAGRLLAATAAALAEGIAVLRAGVRLGDLGHRIQQRLERDNLGVVRELVGHGVGRALHEEPQVPNYGAAGTGAVLREHQVLAIEPMATLGGGEVALAPDGWMWRTRDGSLAAHFEHTVIVTRSGVEVLTKL